MEVDLSCWQGTAAKRVFLDADTVKGEQRETEHDLQSRGGRDLLQDFLLIVLLAKRGWES